MTRPAAKGKTLWPALVAAAALLLTAPQALASRTASSRADLLTSPALDQVPATAHALAPAYVPQGFPLHLDADPHPAAFALFDDLTPTPASERLEPEKLASGVESWVLTPNLQRLQIFVTDSRWCREFLGPVDSPNLYQAFGLDPQNNTDPMGLQESTDSDRPLLNRVEDWFWRTWAGRLVAKAVGTVHETAEQVGTVAEQEARHSIAGKTAINPAVEELKQFQADYIGQPRGMQAGEQGGRALNRGLQKEAGEVVQRGVSRGTEQLAYVGAGKLAATAVEEAAPLLRTKGTRFSEAAASKGAIRAAVEYEKKIRSLYGNATFRQRQFMAVENGRLVPRVADSVARIGDLDFAVEAKYVEDWSKSIRNPGAPVARFPFAEAERQEVIQQARAYSQQFDRVIYHTNSQELIDYYSRAFRDEGIVGVEFKLTPP